ncbi:MAG: DEAD/DEAH box helicase [Clostridiales bacterium]|nr:DEAD/DEAH box helicase [Clostridiales bacterium]
MPDVLPADTPFPKGELIAIATPSGIVLDANPSAKSFYSNDALAESWRKNPFTAFLHFGFEEKDSKMEPSVAFVHSVSRRFAKSLSQDNEIEFTREAKALDDEAAQEIAGEAPFMIGAEYISDTWAKSFWDGLRAAFVADLMQFSGTVKEYLNSRNPKLNVVGRIYFHLVENKRDETGDFPFAFLATYSTNNQAVIKSANKRAANGKSAHVPLKCALNEFGQSNDTLLKLLSTVSQAADKSDFISSLVESGELFSPLRFDTRDAYTFLKEIPVYEECGIMCRIPAWWRKKRKGVSVDVRIGTKNPSRVGIEAILSCIPVLMLDGEEITEEELLAMLEMSAGLVMIKGKWVEVDKEKLQEALAAYQNALAIPSMSMSEALRLQLGMETLEGTEESDVVSVSFGEWLKSVKERMAHPERTPAPALGKSFKAKLRGYQQVGYSWLMSMKSLGFGALLADDMGLGKTVQILAMLEATRQNGDFKCLLVVPASLVTNWEKEIEKFAPELKRKTIHPSFKTATPEALKDASLFITTYGMASRLDYLQQVHWDLLILDEAQAIKNAGTKQTKSVKLINASFKVAMTGTPVENRLTDLWSIFDFLNAGMLGSTKQFADYAADLKESGSYSKLRDTINPFILRRLKTDKTIISDLPDKIEMKDYPQMSKRQASLYKQTLDELVSALNDVEETSIQRKGLVLGSLMRFKQICNHPDQFLGQMEYQEAASGKFPLLREICETIIEKREKVLVFTQFKSIAEPLAAFLESVFHKPGLVIHGGTPVKLRGIYVDKFNNEPESAPFMVLSLKAGGVGLNLTAANHVIHFDRWWNPAVENQATDRAFRIGQTKNVIVHKFITAGTIEEKIDELIEDKLQLSNELIESSTGEAWIANMSNKELLKLLQMR